MYCMVFLLWAAVILCCEGIVLKDNGYEDIYIVIQDTEPESKELLDGIKSAWTDASKFLFKATHQRVYFRKINVIIPNSWSVQPTFRSGPTISFLETPIKVSSFFRQTPFVRGVTKCGTSGQFMMIHPDVILGRISYFGSIDHIIVHEWGHLRWGVFDEYPTLPHPDDNNYKQQFYLADGRWNPVRCTSKINVKAYSPSETCSLSGDQMLHKTCKFSLDPEENIKASLMGHQWIKSLEEFCDTKTESNAVPEELQHNSVAPNMQNQYCHRKSIWEVLREHSDFKDGNSPSLPTNTNTVPEFEFYHESSSVRVLVLDVSGSMSGERLEVLRLSATYVISDGNLMRDGSWLSIVQFSTSVVSSKAMTQINSIVDRQALIASLPNRTHGSTCIGCGLIKALEILRGFLNTQQPEHGEMIVISDGGNNVGILEEAITAVVAAKVAIHTIAISQAADMRLKEMAIRSGGKNFVFLGTGSYINSFADALTGVVSHSVTSESTSAVPIVSDALNVTAGEDNSLQFVLDDGVGLNTSLAVILQQATEINVTLSGPGGLQIKELKAGTRMVSMGINGTAEPGDYVLTITTAANTTAEIHVTSLPLDPRAGVIRTSSRLSQSTIDYSLNALPVIYVDVLHHSDAIVDANVTAVVVTPNGTSCVIQLSDDGQDPDITYKDGTYSGYILRDCQLGNGRYSIKVFGRSGQNTKKRTGIHEASSPYTSGSEQITEEDVSDFERISLPGELVVTKYTSVAGDVTPPGKITDLQVIDIFIDGSNRNYTLTWTATGDDMNTGKAFEYEIRTSDSLDELLNNFTSNELLQLDSKVPPKVAKQSEAITMVVDATNSYTATAFCAIVAIDESGNHGDVSNIVSVIVATGYTVAGSVDIGTHPPVNDTPSDNDDRIGTVAIVLGAAAGVFLLAVIVAALMFFLQRYRKAHTSIA